MSSSQIKLCIVTLLIMSVTSFAQSNKLIGRWQSEADPRDIVELRANGTASTTNGEVRWAVNGNILQVGDLYLAYRLAGDRIFIKIDLINEVAYKKLGTSSKNSQTGAQSKTSNSAQDKKLRQLLLSSAWCSFTYNQTTGTTQTSRVVFYNNGTASMDSGAETYNSGRQGTVAGQSSSGGNLLWKVENGRLYVDSGAGLEDLNLKVVLNSAGNPILTAAGKEYSQCR